MPHRHIVTGTVRGLAAVACLCCLLLWISPAQARAQEEASHTETTVITSLGTGPALTGAVPETFTAVDDARKRSIVLFLIETLGIAEYNRLEEGIESLILTDYESYIIDSTTLTEDRIPLSDDVIVTVRVTLDSASLLSYTENIARLAPPPEDADGPTADEMHSLSARAEEMLLQADVATDVLLDPVKGIESYTEALSLFESARDSEGVYDCLMGIGRAYASLGYLAEAQNAFDRAKDAARSLSDARPGAATRLEIVRLLLLMGNYTGASEEISDILGDIRGAGYDDIEARALEALSVADFALDRPEEALNNILRAIVLYEHLGDRKSHYAAYVTYGLMLLSHGEVEIAIEALKNAKIMSERMEDSERRSLVLTALGSAYAAFGDTEGARLYLDEAVSAAGDGGWAWGEARALIERAKLSVLSGDISRASVDAAAAEDLARALDVPSLLAASLFVRGVIAERNGNRAEALDFYLEAMAEASDIRAAGIRESFAPFTAREMKTCVEAACGIAADMNDPKGAAEAMSYYHSVLIARYLFVETPDAFSLSSREPISIAEWKDIVGLTLGVEAAWKSPVTNSLSGESLNALTVRRGDTLDAFFDTMVTIKKQAPILSLLAGISVPDYSSLRLLLGADGAHVQYFTGPARSFALVITQDDIEIIILPTETPSIMAAVNDLLAAMDETAAPMPADSAVAAPQEDVSKNDTAPAPETGELPMPAFDIVTPDEVARRAAALLLSPVASRLMGKSAVGINPGPELSNLPLTALTDSTGFLSENTAVFYAPALSRRYVTPDMYFPTLTYFMVLGWGHIDLNKNDELFYDAYRVDSLPGGLMMLPEEARSAGDFVLVFNEVPKTPMISHPAALTVFSSPPGDDPISVFSALELFFAAGPQSGVIILPGADTDATNIFFSELILGIREHGTPRGFLHALGTMADPDTAHYLLFGDF